MWSSDNPGEPATAIGLGVRLHLRGDYDAARAAFLEALASGHPDHAPEAAIHLGGLLHSRGHLSDAQAMYQQAAASGHSEHEPRAAVQLGIVLSEQELLLEAREAFEQAISSGHSDHAPAAALHLGQLLERQGDTAGAERTYRVASDSGHPYEAPSADIRLGDLLRQVGKSEDAQASYQRAIDSGHPDEGAHAWFQQASLHVESGDPTSAAEALQHVMESQHRDYAPTAALALGRMREGMGDDEGAARAYEGAAVYEGTHAAQSAAVQLGVLYAQRGDRQRAHDLWRAAEPGLHSYVDACYYLGSALALEGDDVAARPPLQVAADSGDPEFANLAQISLSTILTREGDVAGAKAALQRAFDAGHPSSVTSAAFGLGANLQSQGDIEGARRAYGYVVDSGHPVLTPPAAEALRQLDIGESYSEAEVEAGLEAVEQVLSRSPTPPEVAENPPRLFPLVQPVGWQKTLETEDGRIVCPPARPLRLAGREVGFLIFARQLTEGLSVEIDTGGVDLEQFEAEALANLREARLSWTRVVCSIPEVEEPDVAVLTCAENTFAPAGVLDPILLQEAQRTLGCQRIVVAIPAQGALLAASAEDSSADLRSFARLVARWHVISEWPLTHLTFYATDGEIDGVYEDSDQCLSEVVDAAVPATINLAFAGGPVPDDTWKGLQETLDTGEPIVAGALIETAQSLIAQGDRVGAERALKMVAACRHTEFAAGAKEILRALQGDQVDHEAAAQASAAPAEPVVTVDGHLIYGSATDVYVVPNLPRAGDQDAQDAAMRVALEAGSEFMTKAQGKSWTEPDGTPTPGRNLLSGRMHLDLDTLPPHEAAALRAPASGPLLPVIFPLDWEHTFEIESINGPRRVRATAVPLRLAGQHVGYLAIGRGFGAGLALEGVREDLSIAELQSQALAGLKSLGLHWHARAGGTDTHTHAGVDGAIDGRDVLECSEHVVAASGVLDPDFLLEAQRMLGCSRLVVGLPSRNALWVASADLPSDRLDTFARLVASGFVDSGTPVTHLTFYATDGVVEGIYEESDAALAEMLAGSGEVTTRSVSGSTAVSGDPDEPPLITQAGHLVSRSGAAVHVVANVPEAADHETSVAAIADAVRVGIDEMSRPGGQHHETSDEGPLIPLLEALDWQPSISFDTDDGPQTMASLAVPFHLGGRQVGFLAFGRERYGAMEIQSADEGADSAHVEAEARANLAEIELGWQPILCSAPAAGEGELEVWICNDTAFASSGVLNRSLLLDAHIATGVSRLVVAFPSREVLLAASADDPAQVAAFARLMARWYEIGARAISPLTFYSTDGDIDGVYEEGDRALQEIQASDVGPSIILTWPGDPPALFELLDHRTDTGPGRATDAGRLYRQAEAFPEPDWPRLDPAAVWRDLTEGVAAGRPEAMVNTCQYAEFLMDSQDFDGAQRAYRLVAESGDSEYAVDAMDGLARACVGVNDLVGARDAFQYVVDHGDADHGDADLVDLAAFSLGTVLQQLQDPQGAQRAFQRAIDCGDEQVGIIAAQSLARLLEEHGDPSGAERAYRRADELARALQETVSRNAAAAEEPQLDEIPWDAFQERINSGDTEGILETLGVGLLLSDDGDRAQAARAFRMVLDSGHQEYAADAGLYLGKVLQIEGDIDGARVAYHRAIDCGETAAVQEAGFWLGQILIEQGDTEGACTAWGLVTDPEGEWYAGAALNIGISLKQSGDLSRAAEALRRAAESDNPAVSPGAWNNLASVLWAMGDRPGTQAALQRALESDDAKHAPAAADYLRHHFPELSRTAEFSEEDAPVLPMLQSLAWADTLSAKDGGQARLINGMSRPLVLAGLHVGYVAFSRTVSPVPSQLESPRSLDPDSPISVEYEADALMNLRMLGLEWQRLEIEPPNGEPFDVLACDGHPLAAAAILDRSFLAQAQLILGCDRIVVALPNRDLLQVGRADLPDQQLGHFAGSVEAFYNTNDDPISPLTFYATNGVVDGICDAAPLE